MAVTETGKQFLVAWTETDTHKQPGIKMVSKTCRLTDNYRETDDRYTVSQKETEPEMDSTSQRFPVSSLILQKSFAFPCNQQIL